MNDTTSNLTMWHSCDGHPVPRLVNVEQQGWPHKDADGRTQYENTHFYTEAEAWDHGQQSVDACVSLCAAEVEHVRARLAEAERRLVDAVLSKRKFEVARRDGEANT